MVSRNSSSTGGTHSPHGSQEPQGPPNSRPLSNRETEVLRLTVAGLRTAAIAAVLQLSPNTVKTHLGHAAEKLGAASRAEALHLAVERGLIPRAPQRPRGRSRALTDALRLAAEQGLVPRNAGARERQGP
ncbi:MAG: helix-turn-helix transcriptional regulator [Chloroflexota bacterium]|nr:helix-turn-helix transcriptional regulator [Chloroflexota bacterium]